MKVLLTSVGRRGYLVKYFKQVLGKNGQVWGADNNKYTPAFKYCDKSILLPPVDDQNYINKTINLCINNKIDIVIPLIDNELEILADHKEQFKKENIMIVISPLKTIQITSDKYLTYKFGEENDIPVPISVITVDDALKLIAEGKLKWPVLVKPRLGSASSDIYTCNSENQLKHVFEFCPQPMIQELIEGEEYGYDLFCDKEYHPISVFCKRKLLMRAGETDKAISTNESLHVSFGLKIAQKLQIFGPTDVDVMVNKHGLKLIDINPRFGGGYPCSHLAGANFPAKLIAIRNGNKIEPDIGSCPAGIVMLKQDEIISRDCDNFIST